MKKLLGFVMMGVGVILLLVTASTFFYTKNANSKVSEVTENIDGINELSLESKAVNWTIVPTDDKELRVSITGEEVKDIFNVKRNSRKLEILTEQKGFRWFPSFFGDLKDREAVVYLPKNYTKDLNLSTVSGVLTLDGDFTFEDIDVEMVSGGFTNSGLLHAETVNVDSVSGKVELADITSDEVQADSVSGNIEFGYSDEQGDIQVDTVSGDVRVSAPKWNAHYNVDTLSGTITEQGSSVKAREYSNSIGDGDYQISISTLSGDITFE
ncbi:DUF4097 family beta strand repeat-containing protein [Alkalicoccobacillus plakortidis]|uniref:DUF4097 domain-containing protein n=1 Tax=Alkalicoccobacillus plakortidis TaxID=444060 RepID=A0ABT0XLR7_9BACI|nr:DUF4097 family beta strand repeat-containing protein [Alkalicoccobacillus plakortidis]MCM2676660.1 DUF4097 domain-containing protein [Alkalicoccobacillus plakortidis]